MGADYLGLQNAGAEYLGPFFAKSGADYLGGQITFLVGQNTWASPKVGGRIPGRRKRLGGRPAGCDTFLDFMAAAGEGTA